MFRITITTNIQADVNFFDQLIKDHGLKLKLGRYDIMVTQHIPTMTDSHHGGFLSVMIMVGICQVTNSHHK